MAILLNGSARSLQSRLVSQRNRFWQFLTFVNKTGEGGDPKKSQCQTMRGFKTTYDLADIFCEKFLRCRSHIMSAAERREGGESDNF